MNPVLDLIQQLLNSYNSYLENKDKAVRDLETQMSNNDATVNKSVESINTATEELKHINEGSQRANSDFMTVEQLCAKYGISVQQIKASEQQYYLEAEKLIKALNATLAEASRSLELAKQSNDDLTSQINLIKADVDSKDKVLTAKIKEMIEAMGQTVISNNISVPENPNIAQLENPTSTMVDVTTLFESTRPEPVIEPAPVIEDIQQPFAEAEISGPIIPETTAEKISCPGCSAMIPGDSTVCPVCSYDLTKKVEASYEPTTPSVPSREETIAKYQQLSTLGLSDDKIDTIITNVTPEAFNDMLSILTVNGVDVTDIKDNIDVLAYNSPSQLSLVFATLKELGKNNDANAFSDQADMIITASPESIKANYEYLKNKGVEVSEISILDLCTIDLVKKAEEFTKLGVDFMALRKQKPYMIATLTLDQLLEAFGIAKEMAGASI